MGSDGASVMLGCKNVVAAKLRELQPSLVAVHCYAHRLELAFKDAVKKVPMDTKVTTCLLQGIYYLYHNSALNRANLLESFKTLGMKVLLPTRIGGTRWIGHLLRALTNFLSGYKAIRQQLEQVLSPNERVSNSTSGKAKGILKLMKSPDIMAYCCFLAEIATILSRVSRAFLKRNCCAADLHGVIEETTRLLGVYSTKDGPFMGKLQGLISDGDNEQLRHGKSFQSSRKIVADNLIKSLDNRFEMSNVIQAMSIANFRMWPLAESDAQEREDFGDGGLAVILDHYKTSFEHAGVDPTEAVIEWSALKSALYTQRPQEIRDMTWMKANGLCFSSQYGNILAVIDLILSIPGSSSECERGFRQLKGTKTTYRTALSMESLSSQLTVKLQSPSIEEFDPMPAIQLGTDGCGTRRRPLTMDHVKRRDVQVEEEAATEQLTQSISEALHQREPLPATDTSSSSTLTVDNLLAQTMTAATTMMTTSTAMTRTIAPRLWFSGLCAGRA